MAVFRFRFQAVLQVRRHRRDQCRLLLAALAGREQDVTNRRRQFSRQLAEQLEGLRRLGAPGKVDIAAGSVARAYAGQLSNTLQTLDHALGQLATEVAGARQALMCADQAVTALERLSENQQAEFLLVSERREALELEDNWRVSRPQ